MLFKLVILFLFTLCVNACPVEQDAVTLSLNLIEDLQLPCQTVAVKGRLASQVLDAMRMRGWEGILTENEPADLTILADPSLEELTGAEPQGYLLCFGLPQESPHKRQGNSLTNQGFKSAVESLNFTPIFFKVYRGAVLDPFIPYKVIFFCGFKKNCLPINQQKS